VDRLLSSTVEYHGDADFLLIVRRNLVRRQCDEQHKHCGNVRGRRDSGTTTKRWVGAAEPAHSCIGNVQNALQHAVRLTRLSGPRALT
jgi:hypothetical protein